MLEDSLRTFTEQVKTIVQEFETQLWKTLNFSVVEKAISEILEHLATSLLEQLLKPLLRSASFLGYLKVVAGRMGMHFKEYRPLTVRLYNGHSLSVESPYFIKAVPKKGKKGKRCKKRQGAGAHVGLEVLGFIGRASSHLVSEVVSLALLCPSFAVAHEVLCERGLHLDVKTIRRLCRELGQVGLSERGRISLVSGERVRGHTLVIGIDGGRLRERRKKRGRKKKDQKRQGYHTDWKEPKLFTIYLWDERGQLIKDFAPLHDATMEDHEGAFALLEQYLCALDLSEVARVAFTGDGAPWIWSDAERLVVRLGLEQVYQVLDYTHAKQNLAEIIDLIEKPHPKRKQLTKHWQGLLWRGEIAELGISIGEQLQGLPKQKALKKWQNYFDKNAKRMQYSMFKGLGLPCGSGSVESAIRRVINLRLKSAGSFWKREMAEYFLFLRSQLLSGRWLIFMDNVRSRRIRLVDNVFFIGQGLRRETVRKAA